MIDTGSTYSEILQMINQQPSELKSLIERNYLLALQECGNESLINLVMKWNTTGSGIGNRGFNDAIEGAKNVLPTIYKEFHVFIIH